MSAARDLAELVQDAIDRGATTVEDIHRAIADLPLKALEEVRFLEKPIKEIRKVQDQSIGAVYKLIRDINSRAGKLAKEMLSSRSSAGTRRATAKTARRRA